MTCIRSKSPTSKIGILVTTALRCVVAVFVLTAACTTTTNSTSSDSEAVDLDLSCEPTKDSEYLVDLEDVENNLFSVEEALDVVVEEEGLPRDGYREISSGDADRKVFVQVDRDGDVTVVIRLRRGRSLEAWYVTRVTLCVGYL